MERILKEELLEKAKDFDVKFIRLQFTDIFGVFKNVAITIDELPKALDGKLYFDSSIVHGSIQKQEVDICLMPDMDTFVIFPWRPREGAVARLICDIYNLDGTPFEGCSRNTLKRALEKMKAAGYDPMVSPETEFFLFHNDERGNPSVTPHDRAGYGDLTPLDLGENARRDMVLTLEGMGFQISSSHHEWSPGQHEIVLKAEDALKTADNIVTFKFVIRTIAQRHGLHASFMPKPLANVNGSAMHLSTYLYKEGRNVLTKDYSGLTEIGKKYIAGIIKNAEGMTAITNPIVNSYKRLLPGDFAPCYLAWSDSHRNTMIRVPAEGQENAGVEVRSPDPACNPYLTIALIVGAGLDGINGNNEPPKSISDKKLLPQSLPEALSKFRRSRFVKDILGNYIFQKYLDAKEKEWERFSKEIHPWELKEYLSVY